MPEVVLAFRDRGEQIGPLSLQSQDLRILSRVVKITDCIPRRYIPTTGTVDTVRRRWHFEFGSITRCDHEYALAQLRNAVVRGVHERHCRLVSRTGGLVNGFEASAKSRNPLVFPLECKCRHVFKKKHARPYNS